MESLWLLDEGSSPRGLGRGMDDALEGSGSAWYWQSRGQLECTQLIKQFVYQKARGYAFDAVCLAYNQVMNVREPLAMVHQPEEA